MGGLACAPVGARGVRFRGRGPRHLHRPRRGRRGRDAARRARGVRLPQQPSRLARPRSRTDSARRCSPRANATVRAASRSSWGPALPACSRPSAPTSAAIRARARCRRTSASPRPRAPTRSSAFVRVALGLEGPGARRVDRLFVEREGVRERGAAASARGSPTPRSSAARTAFASRRCTASGRSSCCRARRAVRTTPSGTASRSARAPGSRCSSATGDGPALAGVGESCDAYHMSTPHPEGLGARLAMERALAAAGLARRRGRLRQPARHGDPHQRRRRGPRRPRRVRAADAVQRDQGCARAPARRRRYHRGDRRAARARARLPAGYGRTRARSTSKCACRVLIEG